MNVQQKEQKKTVIESIDYNSPDYKRSRKSYMAQCTFEYFVSLLVTDAFLAKLLQSIGASDTMIGIISSFISFAFLFQLLSIWLAQKITNVKRTVIIFDTVSQLFFMAMYAVPFLSIEKEYKIIIIITCILIAYVNKYLISSIFFKWANSYVDPSKRGSYSAVKEMTSLAVGIIFTLIVGYIIDAYESIDNLKGGFVFIAASMLILNICNYISLVLIKSDMPEKAVHKKPIGPKKILRNTLGNKNFLNVVIMYSIWEMGIYISIGFMGIFKTKDLLLSVGAVQVINMIANLVRFLVSKPFGKYSDKKSFAKGMELAFVIAAVGYLFNIFTSGSTRWCIVVFTVLYNVSIAGTNQNGFNIVYSYVKSDYIVHALVIRGSIAGVFGFLASLVGGKILSAIQANSNIIFGFHLYGQQVLSAISLLLIITAIMYNRCIVEKQTITLQ